MSFLIILSRDRALLLTSLCLLLLLKAFLTDLKLDAVLRLLRDSGILLAHLLSRRLASLLTLHIGLYTGLHLVLNRCAVLCFRCILRPCGLRCRLCGVVIHLE